MELAFRESLKKMRGTKSKEKFSQELEMSRSNYSLIEWGTKSKEKFSQELEMSRSNYSLIESGKSDPTLKTLERIAELTNSTLVIDLIPNELEQVELQIEEEKQWLSLIYLTKLLLIFFKSGILDITKQRTE